MFNLGLGEIVVLLLLGLILLGSGKLSDLPGAFARARSNAWRPNRERRRVARAPWTRSEWFLVGAVLTLASLSLAIAGARR
ncbi:MAG TPA: hypothetical protein VHL80_13380 [Polyangia bacterium]|nr:hypothetical protein [Polyangia bacterium]